MRTTPEVARYLLELEDALALSPAARARALAEVEQHLTEAVEEQLAGGQDRAAAERLVLRAFGGVGEVAEAFRVEAGRHAAPYTLLRRVDVWRTQHLWLGAVVGALPFVAFIVAVVTVLPLAFSLFPPGGYRGLQLRFLVAFLPVVGLGWMAGQLALGLAVRDRPEPAFSSRVRALRLSHPRRVVLLVGVPYVLAFELALVFTMDFSAGMALMPLIFLACAFLANSKAQLVRPLRTISGWQPVLMMAAAGVPAIVAFGQGVRGVVAWASLVAIFAAAQAVQRRQVATGSWNVRTAVGITLLAMAAGMLVYSVILTGSLAAWSIGIPLVFVVAFAPVLLWSFRRVASDAERARLKADAELAPS